MYLRSVLNILYHLKYFYQHFNKLNNLARSFKCSYNVNEYKTNTLLGGQQEKMSANEKTDSYEESNTNSWSKLKEKKSESFLYQSMLA